MKVVLTGCTGLVGAEVLNQCIRHPQITSVVTLTRRPLAAEIAANSKVQSIIVNDFSTYLTTTVHACASADACIWALGGQVVDSAVEIDYPLAFARAVASNRGSRTTQFRYCHTSGVLAERDQAKGLLFMQEGRRLKGRAETELLEFEKRQGKGMWVTYVARPSMVMPRDASWIQKAGGQVLGSVKVEWLAAAMIDAVTNGTEKKVMENADLVKQGREAYENVF